MKTRTILDLLRHLRETGEEPELRAELQACTRDDGADSNGNLAQITPADDVDWYLAACVALSEYDSWRQQATDAERDSADLYLRDATSDWSDWSSIADLIPAAIDAALTPPKKGVSK